MKLPKRKRIRGEQIDYFVEIAFKEDTVLKLIEIYGPDFATWTAAGNTIGSDAINWDSYRNKLMMREQRKREKE